MSSTPEPEWTPDQVALLQGLTLWESVSICPICHGERVECQDPASVQKYRSGPPTRCHRATAQARDSERIRKEGFEYPEALLSGVHYVE